MEAFKATFEGTWLNIKEKEENLKPFLEASGSSEQEIAIFLPAVPKLTYEVKDDACIHMDFLPCPDTMPDLNIPVDFKLGEDFIHTEPGPGHKSDMNISISGNTMKEVIKPIDQPKKKNMVVTYNVVNSNLEMVSELFNSDMTPLSPPVRYKAVYRKA